MITKCNDCETLTTVTLESYGSSFMAKFDCPECGISYDTNLDSADIENIKGAK
jgi:hypothetical protein